MYSVYVQDILREILFRLWYIFIILEQCCTKNKLYKYIISVSYFFRFPLLFAPVCEQVDSCSIFAVAFQMERCPCASNSSRCPSKDRYRNFPTYVGHYLGIWTLPFSCQVSDQSLYKFLCFFSEHSVRGSYEGSKMPSPLQTRLQVFLLFLFFLFLQEFFDRGIPIRVGLRICYPYVDYAVEQFIPESANSDVSTILCVVFCCRILSVSFSKE